MTALLFGFAMIDNLLLMFINIYNVSAIKERSIDCETRCVDYYTLRFGR